MPISTSSYQWCQWLVHNWSESSLPVFHEKLVSVFHEKLVVVIWMTIAISSAETSRDPHWKTADHSRSKHISPPLHSCTIMWSEFKSWCSQHRRATILWPPCDQEDPTEHLQIQNKPSTTACFFYLTPGIHANFKSSFGMQPQSTVFEVAPAELFGIQCTSFYFQEQLIQQTLIDSKMHFKCWENFKQLATFLGGIPVQCYV